MERFLPRVDSDVVYEFVLGFEGLALPGAVLPLTDMTRLLGARDVLHAQVSHQLMQAAERFGTAALVCELAIHPPAHQLTFDGLQVGVERCGAAVRRGAHVEVDGVVALEQRGHVVVAPRPGHLAVPAGPGDEVPRYPQRHVLGPGGRAASVALVVQGRDERVTTSVRVAPTLVVHSLGRAKGSLWHIGCRLWVRDSRHGRCGERPPAQELPGGPHAVPAEAGVALIGDCETGAGGVLAYIVRGAEL